MRRRRAPKRQILPDPKYRDYLLAKFINVVMERGKKSVAQSIVYNALDTLAQKTGKNSLEVFKQALDNARPLLETKSRRVGGATYQVPVEVNMERGHSLAMRWVRTFASQKKGQPMEKKLANELLDAYNKTGSSIKKREDTHKMAESNKAFSHYRW
ncbi:MAG TPA: 30S ribosomal protein S7 [Candidatus Omnitrophota bacterium]|nr:30S ribosomal protein S7 [Candidatus Omnitrophota bacterium]